MVRVRDARSGDAAAIAALANALIPTTTYTWTDRIESVDERAAWMSARMPGVGELRGARLDLVLLQRDIAE